MRSRVDLAVIVLNWNAAEDTKHCLSRLEAWKHLQPSIYVVDNCSTDTSVKEIATGFPNVEIIKNATNAGFSGGNNIALRKILDLQSTDVPHNASQFLLLLNNDAFIEEDSLERLLDSLDNNPDVGVTGPLLFTSSDFNSLLSAGGLDPARHGRTYWAGTTAEKHLAGAESSYDVDYVSGTVALLRKSVVCEAGLFDEEYFFSCEMADLCERIKKIGYSCTINPAVKAWHDMGPSGKQRDTLYLYYSLRNRFLFIRKFRRQNLIRLFSYWVFVGLKGMVKNLVMGKFATVRAIALALRDGVSGCYGGRNELFLSRANREKN